MLACNCLNVVIELEKNNKVTKELLELSDEEKCDSFFQQEVWHVGRLVSIKKLYSGLVHSRQIGLWTISRCLNCDVQTHAIHRDKGASYVLVHSKLLNQEAISNIKSSNGFSTMFQIIVNPNNVGSDNTTIDTYPYKEVEKVIKSINEVVTNYIRKEQASVEEKIKKFSDEQYELLNEAKDNAFREREALVRVVNNAAKEAKFQHQSPKSPMKIANFSTDSCSVPNSPSSVPFSPKRSKSTETAKQKTSDYRDDLMFDFEVEEVTGEGISFRNRNLEDSESDDIEEAEDAVNEAAGISIFQSNSSRSGTLAQSCPVDIPIFSPLSRSRNSRGDASEDTDDFSPRSKDVDIAASIKALARSVHGDTVFGDLPRPRFSTQI